MADSDALKSAAQKQASEIVATAHTEADTKKKELDLVREAAGMTDEEAAKLEADATAEAKQAQDDAAQLAKKNAAAAETATTEATTYATDLTSKTSADAQNVVDAARAAATKVETDAD